MISVFVCVVVVVVDEDVDDGDVANIVPHSPPCDCIYLYTILMSAAFDQVFRRSLYDYTHFNEIDSHFQRKFNPITLRQSCHHLIKSLR